MNNENLFRIFNLFFKFFAVAMFVFIAYFYLNKSDNCYVYLDFSILKMQIMGKDCK